MAWLLTGFLLWLIFTERITKNNVLTWAGFFIVAFLYINILRERVRYGDIDYYTQAAFALINDKPLPDSYLYPPLWATLLSFLTALGEEGILLIAWIANVLSLFLFYFLLHRILEHYQFKPNAAALIATLFILVNMPLIRTLMYVQVNFHVMNLIFLSILFYKDRLFLSALCIGAGSPFQGFSGRSGPGFSARIQLEMACMVRRKHGLDRSFYHRDLWDQPLFRLHQ